MKRHDGTTAPSSFLERITTSAQPSQEERSQSYDMFLSSSATSTLVTSSVTTTSQTATLTSTASQTSTIRTSALTATTTPPPVSDDPVLSASNPDNNTSGSPTPRAEPLPNTIRVAIALGCLMALILVSLSLFLFRDRIFCRRKRTAVGRGRGNDDDERGEEEGKSVIVEMKEIKGRGSWGRGLSCISEEDGDGDVEQRRSEEEGRGKSVMLKKKKEDSEAQVLSLRERFQALEFDFERVDDDEILPVPGQEKRNVVDELLTVPPSPPLPPPVNPRPTAEKERHDSGVSFGHMPALDKIKQEDQDQEQEDTTPSETHPRDFFHIGQASSSSSRLPTSLPRGFDLSPHDWPFDFMDWPSSDSEDDEEDEEEDNDEDDDEDDKDQTNDPSISTPPLPLGQESEHAVRLTSQAAPGYTCPVYTPSKYHPSPPSNLVNNLVDDSTPLPHHERSQSWPLRTLAITTPVASPLLFHGHNDANDDKKEEGDERSVYHSSPPPTLPNANRPLSLVQEYSLAAFPPVSPLVFHGQENNDGKEEDGRSEYRPTPPPTDPNAKRPLSLVQEYSLPEFPPTTAASPSPGPSLTFTPTPLSFAPLSPDQQAARQQQQEKQNNSSPISDDDDSGGVPLPAESPSSTPSKVAAFPPVVSDEANNTPLHRTRTLSSTPTVIWEEEAMEHLILQTSRRDSAREKERDEEHYHSSFSFSHAAAVESMAETRVGKLKMPLPVLERIEGDGKDANGRDLGVMGRWKMAQRGGGLPRKEEDGTSSHKFTTREERATYIDSGAAVAADNSDKALPPLPPNDFPEDGSSSRPMMKGCEGQ